MSIQIIIVSGLPRSGTSLMMQILRAAGVPILSDGLREADIHNPRGYFEFEAVKKLPQDSTWLQQAHGKAVKIISHYLKYLPTNHSYRVLFMQRKLEEVLASQNRMLEALNKTPGTWSDAQWMQYFRSHLADIHLWMDKQPHISYMDVSYHHLLYRPEFMLKKIGEFLHLPMDLPACKEVIDRGLYRNRY